MTRPLSEAPMVDFDQRQDAYAYVKQLREQSPIARTPMGIVLALRHRHLELVTSDATRQLETETKVMQGITSGPIWDITTSGMLFANGEAHRRRRRRSPKPSPSSSWTPCARRRRDLAAELINERLGKGAFDFVGEFAAQIPARIIADILGIPRSDLPVFMQWIADTAASHRLHRSRANARRSKASLVAFNAYVDDLLNDRRAAPRGDFISHYVEETGRAGELNEAEIRTQVLGLILAGSDTTRGSLCMTLASCCTHPDQWRAFCADPDGLKKGVVDEGLRYQPIVSGIPRVAVRGHGDRRLSHPGGHADRGVAALGAARPRSLRRPGDASTSPAPIIRAGTRYSAAAPTAASAKRWRRRRWRKRSPPSRGSRRIPR